MQMALYIRCVRTEDCFRSFNRAAAEVHCSAEALATHRSTIILVVPSILFTRDTAAPSAAKQDGLLGGMRRWAMDERGDGRHLRAFVF